ncbi:dihydrofolate reductase [Erwinia phage vEam_S_24]|nr:dihydrofolate reductase [Erwinia phage Hena2]
MIATVYAINSVGAFGNYDGSLPWPKNSEDLMRFSEITKNIGSVLMGKSTYKSLVARKENQLDIHLPLPERNAIILTSELPCGTKLEFGEVVSYKVDGKEVHFICHETTTAIKLAEKFFGDVAVIGGSGIIAEALPLTDQLYLTVLDSNEQADIMVDFEVPIHLQLAYFERLRNGTGKTFHYIEGLL